MTRSITFDSIKGTPVADGKAEELALKLHKSGRNFKTSTDNLIHATRALICEGAIPHSSVVFMFNGEKIQADKDGRIADWPLGFCDHQMNLLARLCSPHRDSSSK